MLAGLIFLFAPEKLTNKFQFSFARIFHWPLGIGRNISLSASAQQSPANVVSRREYNKLQNYLVNITEELAQERQKVQKLSGLHNRRPMEGAKLVFADVITAPVGVSKSELIINRGRDDGLAEGQFVLGDHSIIGTISDVDWRTARVRLITDPESKLAVKIGQLDAGLVMQGNGSNSAKARLLPIKHTVKLGDTVCALKKPGFLDTPMIAGIVAQFKSDDENPLVWDITVKPACEIEALIDVAVIIMNPQSN